MAQKREKEETELKVPEALTLCTAPIAGATSISGSEDRKTSPERSDLNVGQSVESRSSSGVSPEIKDLVSGSGDRKTSPDRSDRSAGNSPENQDSVRRPAPEEDSGGMKKREVNRCSGCRRKIGLIGFRCRCGDVFCSDHRYSDRHECCYDYKAAGREVIARENPVVRAAKILKV